MLWVCDLLRSLFHSVYSMVKFCVHQYIGGRAGPSAQWHRRKECDKSEPDLQLPQEQDVQKDQGEFLFILPSRPVLHFEQRMRSQSFQLPFFHGLHFEDIHSELYFSLCLLHSDIFSTNCAGSFPVCPFRTALRQYWEMIICPVFTFPSSLFVVHFIPHRYMQW